jgi:hypothetical protein
MRQVRTLASYLTLGAGLFLFSSLLSIVIPHVARQTLDIWLGADVPRVIDDMTNPLANHWRTIVHPIFPLILLPVGGLLTKLAPSQDIAAQILISLSAAITGILLFATTQNLGIKPIDSWLLIGAFASSSAFIFWWSIPETFPIGSLTILIPFFLLSYEERSFKTWTLALAGSLAITTTNFSAGIIAVAFSKQRQNFFKISFFALLLILALSFLQKSYLPSANYFFVRSVAGERHFVTTSTDPRGSLPGRALDFAVYTGVVPDNPTRIDHPSTGNPIIFFPHTLKIFTSFRSIPAICWIALVSIGSIKLFQNFQLNLAKALFFFLLTQFAFHMIYGDQPFLYSAHFLPEFILLISLSFRPATPRALLILARSCIIGFVFLAFPLNLYSLINMAKLASSFSKN